jgi:hypothetical protein
MDTQIEIEAFAIATDQRSDTISASVTVRYPDGTVIEGRIDYEEAGHNGYEWRAVACDAALKGLGDAVSRTIMCVAQSAVDNEIRPYARTTVALNANG